MTVNISKKALNLREELAALRNQGGAYEESKFYLDSLVTNGTFDSDTSGWIGANGATLSVVSGVMRITNSTANYGYASDSLTTIVGKTYVLSLDYVLGTSSSASVRVGTGQGGSDIGSLTVSSSGAYSITFEATTTSTYILILNLSPTAAQYSDVDNISIYETDGTNAIHSTPHGYSIKDVYIDGELAREGSAYDYTVHDGYIKPTIAPTATTETCLIGVRT